MKRRSRTLTTLEVAPLLAKVRQALPGAAKSTPPVPQDISRRPGHRTFWVVGGAVVAAAAAAFWFW